MKILYLTDQLYLHGGVEKILTQKINYLIGSLDNEVILITTEQRNKPFVYPISDRMQHFDLSINYDRNSSYFSIGNLSKSFQHVLKLKKILKQIKPEIIVSVGFTPEQYALPLLAQKIPIIKELHFSGHILKNQKGLLSPKNLMNIFFKKYSRVVVLNEDEEKYFPLFKTIVIPNFVDVTEMNLNQENTVIAAGRIAPVKQFDHLIKAWSMIADQHPRWKVKIFGEGDIKLKKELNKLIIDLGIEQSLELKEPTSEISKEMAKASIYAMTSETECFPMVLLESQALGLAAISYDCPNGPRHILENQVTGIIIENQNISTFATKLSDLINDPEKLEYISKNSILNSQKYKVEIIMAHWDKLLQTVIYETKN